MVLVSPSSTYLHSGIRPLRVAHCIHGLSLAGAQQVIRYIVTFGDTSRFRYFVYAHLDGPVREHIESAGATVRMIRRRVALCDPLWAFELGRAMRRDEIDIVHTHLFGDSLHGWAAAKAAGRLPVVTTLHSNRGGETPLRRWGYRRLLPLMDRVVACSESSRSSYMREHGERLGIRTITNGIPPAAPEENHHEPPDLGLEAPVVASIGRQTSEKGFADLIRAFAQIDTAKVGKVQLALLGDGPLRPQLERLAERLGIADRVRFAGIRTDVRELLPSFDVVAFASHHEGMPIAVLEAMAAGRCIVATDADGILGCVADRSEALIAPRNNPEAMARALEEALLDATLRERLGAAARERFEREFRAEKMAAEYERLYLEVAADQDAP